QTENGPIIVVNDAVRQKQDAVGAWNANDDAHPRFLSTASGPHSPPGAKLVASPPLKKCDIEPLLIASSNGRNSLVWLALTTNSPSESIAWMLSDVGVPGPEISPPPALVIKLSRFSGPPPAPPPNRFASGP